MYPQIALDTWRPKSTLVRRWWRWFRRWSLTLCPLATRSLNAFWKNARLPSYMQSKSHVFIFFILWMRLSIWYSNALMKNIVSIPIIINIFAVQKPAFLFRLKFWTIIIVLWRHITLLFHRYDLNHLLRFTISKTDLKCRFLEP